MPPRHRSRGLVALLAAVGAVACGGLAQHGLAGTRSLATPQRAAIGTAVPPHVASSVRRQALRAVARRWPAVRVASGDVAVGIRVSTSYVDAEEAAQRWGEFLLRLIHGAEIDGVTVYLGTPGEVAAICGIDASGCYGSDTSAIVSIGDDSTGVRPEAILAHEYGHFVAANRNNAPWRALDWGTKRWSSLLGVCAGVRAKKLFPRDQLWNYALNPGEGFAEAYRVLNQESVAGGAMDWPIVHRRFLPNGAALEAIRRDILTPWSQPTELRFAGRIGRDGRARVLVPTPLDGQLELRADGAATQARRLVCGIRRTPVTLVGRPGARFTVEAVRP